MSQPVGESGIRRIFAFGSLINLMVALQTSVGLNGGIFVASPIPIPENCGLHKTVGILAGK